MRKLLILLIAILSIAGCATTQTAQTTQPLKELPEIPDYIQMRKPLVIYEKLLAYYGMTYSDVPLHFYNVVYPAAWTDDTGVHITTAMFAYRDSAIASVMAHELAHIKLDHLSKRRDAQKNTSDVIQAVNLFVPGAGLVGLIINPTVVSAYSREQEFEADHSAALAVKQCFNVSFEEQAAGLKWVADNKYVSNGGGIWDQHPTWEERLEKIRHADTP